MAVYKRSYSAYEGALSPRWSRFLILTRYSARSLFQSRLMTGFFLMCFLCPLIMIAGLYFNHNTHVLSLLHMHAKRVTEIDGKFFMTLMTIQCSLAFLVTALIGPGLVSPDLANNALPLYFCRPLSRTDYVLGRAGVIVFLLSLITWIPGLLIYGIEWNLAEEGWGGDHLAFVSGILVGSWLWIAVLALLALALSAWVRWKLVAGGLLLGIMFATTAFAAAVEKILDSNAGFFLDPAALIAVIYAHFFDVPVHTDIETWQACVALAGIGAFCVWLLSKKIRAFQVVK